MKRLRSFDNDLDVVGGDKGSCKDWERRDRDRDRERSRDRDRDRSLERSSSSHRSSRYYSSKAENVRNRTIDDDRESSRLSRKRLDHHEYDGFDRRSPGFDRRRTSPRYRDSIDRDRGVSISSPRNVYGNSDRIHRSESFSGFRRDFPKGYVSERERERSSREESVSSWRRLSGCKDIVEEDYKLGAELGRGSRVLLEDRGNVKSPQGSREVARSPQGSREVLKSPQGSREVIKSPQSSREVIKSSQSPRDVVKSPPESKDSWGEQSKSVDGKRSDEVHGVSSSSSEMEEGELGPETEPELESIPEPLVQTNIEAEISLRDNSESKDFVPEEKIQMEKTLIDDSEPLSEKKLEHDMEGVCDENEEGRMLDTMTAASKGSNGLQECCSASEEKDGNIREDNDFLHSSDHVTAEKDGNEEVNNANSDKSSSPYEEPKEKDGLYLELQVEEIDSKELSMEENRNTGKTLALMTDTLMGKDKGKRVAIYPSSEVNSRENSQWFERDLLGCRDDALEGPSSRGFELFSSSVVSRPEKTNHSVVSNDGKLKDEPLELSLGLPNVLLPLPSHDLKAAPSSPSRARSVQSLPNTFRTSSEGFSGSMSFSGSQTFVHNPSCSLTQNSYENYEQSVGSHPIFQGIDQQASQVTWPGQFPNDPKHVDSPIYQRLLYGNGSLGSHTPQGIIYSQAMQAQQHKFQLTEGNTGIPVALDRQSNLHRQLSGLQSKNNIEVRSPTNSLGSRGTRSEFSNDKKHIMKGRNGSLYRSSSQRAMDQIVVGGIGFVERIITMIISEPVQVMARRIQEMEEQSITFLKESACEIMVNKDKHGQLVVFQEALKKRSDLTVEELLKCHRVQLEILVAFKTGLQDFFKRVSSVASSDLAEIYLNLRCRNLACLSLLPVDDCDCKVCVQKNGFCSACMCLICSKFDMALNTCSWVGCDACLHWCHTDCGLEKSYVRNGRISGEAQDTTEMQFHCVACNFPSEMFGFVKDVFKTCAKEWSIETLTKELEYVKRIFSASNDRRGKQLYIIADKMIARLEIKSNLTEVYNRIMQFLAESDTDLGNTPSVSLKERPHKNSAEDSNRVAGPSQVAMMLASASNENIPQRESTNTAPSRLDWDQVGGRSGNLELQVSVGKMPVVDELESIIRIKLAEAKMFQSRADDARKEAEGLKCIAVAKNDKIDEEYSSRITKLRLAEAEERHKQKLEELKIMEKEHREYFNMKMRMESDIRVLLLKMEATKQNYST